MIWYDGSPYLRQTWFFNLRLHIFYRGDHDQDCHDHPWAFWTFPFTSYVEEVAVQTNRWRARENIRCHGYGGEGTILAGEVLEEKHIGVNKQANWYRRRFGTVVATGEPNYEEVLVFTQEVPKLEPIYETKLQVVKAFRLHYRPAEHTHRVLGRWWRTGWCKAEAYPEVMPDRIVNDGGGYPGPAERRVPRKMVTLVWRGGFVRPWGFLKLRDGRWCWQDWRSYVHEGGRTAPCE